MTTTTKTQQLPFFEIKEEAQEFLTPLLYSLTLETHKQIAQHTTAFMDTSVFVDARGELGIAFGFRSIIRDYQCVYMTDFLKDAELGLKQIEWSAKELGSVYHHKLLDEMIRHIAANAKDVIMLRKDEENKNLNKKTKKVINNSYWLDSVDYVVDDFGIIR